MPTVRRIDGRGALGAAVLAGVIAALALPGSASAAQVGHVTVLAPSSLRNAMTAIDGYFHRWTTNQIDASYAPTAEIARRIEGGEAADIVVTADEAWMDDLSRHGAIRADSRADLLADELVVVAPKGAPAPLSLAKDGDLVGRLGGGPLAIGDPANDPAGRYGKAALEKLGLWSGVAGTLAPAPDAHAVLAMVDNGKAPLGIVYRTDAAVDRDVTVVATFPADSHPPIRFPVALTAATTNNKADLFYSYLRSAEAQVIFHKFGFELLARAN